MRIFKCCAAFFIQIILMNNWNRMGYGKAIILLLLAIPNFIKPASGINQFLPAAIFMLLIFPTVSIPIIAGFYRSIGSQISKPNWNDSPFRLKRPLVFFQFMGVFFLVMGGSMIVGKFIYSRGPSIFGFYGIFFGIGILFGIWIAVKLVKPR